MKERHQHVCVCVCAHTSLTGRWWFWCLCPVRLFSGCVPPSRWGGQQSCCEPESSEEPHQRCKQKPLVTFLSNHKQIIPNMSLVSRAFTGCCIIQSQYVLFQTYVLVSLASCCMISRIMRQAAEHPSGLEWMLIGFSAAPAFSLRCTSILQPWEKKNVKNHFILSPGSVLPVFLLLIHWTEPVSKIWYDISEPENIWY